MRSDLNYRGYECPKCGSPSGVSNTERRSINGQYSIYRRRRCHSCDHRYNTYEISHDAIKAYAVAADRLDQLRELLREPLGIPKDAQPTKEAKAEEAGGPEGPRPEGDGPAVECADRDHGDRRSVLTAG